MSRELKVFLFYLECLSYVQKRLFSTKIKPTQRKFQIEVNQFKKCILIISITMKNTSSVFYFFKRRKSLDCMRTNARNRISRFVWLKHSSAAVLKKPPRKTNLYIRNIVKKELKNAAKLCFIDEILPVL